jgi:DNA invertase Pin-like site-specific DNA recombinase
MAIVYVRQSTQHQVLEHRESTARQYALADRAVALGWPAAAVEVIDEDQGRSGSSVEGRSGFQRLLAAVSSDRVGIILGLEMSRLARSCKDWHALLELCAIYRTLLADADGLYDPSQYNDRLLLGLKGTMSEAELHILKSRLQQGMWNKAERGEVLNHPPIGYVRTPVGDFVIDPDEQVRSVVRLVFNQFARRGSVNGLLRWLAHHDIKLPVRPHFGHVASPDLRRRLSVGASRTGSPEEGSGATDHGADVQSARRMPRADPRPVPGLYHVARI